MMAVGSYMLKENDRTFMLSKDNYVIICEVHLLLSAMTFAFSVVEDKVPDFRMNDTVSSEYLLYCFLFYNLNPENFISFLTLYISFPCIIVF